LGKKTKWYDEIEGTVCTVIMAIMLVMLFWQVIARYIFGISSAQIDELSRYMLVWLAYISTAYAIVHNAHIKIDIFMNVWPKRWRRAVKLFSNVIFFAYSVIVTYYSAVWLAGLSKSGAITLGLKAPMALFCSIIPISHFVMAIRLVQLQVRMVRDPHSTDDPAEAAPEELSGGQNNSGEAERQ